MKEINARNKHRQKTNKYSPFFIRKFLKLGLKQANISFHYRSFISILLKLIPIDLSIANCIFFQRFVLSQIQCELSIDTRALSQCCCCTQYANHCRSAVAVHNKLLLLLLLRFQTKRTNKLSF